MGGAGVRIGRAAWRTAVAAPGLAASQAAQGGPPGGGVGD